LEAAYHAQQRGAETWWISAEEIGSLIAGMLTVGSRLGVSDTDLKREDVADLIWQRLDGRMEPWVLVIDGADDPQVLAGRAASVGEGRGWLRPATSPMGTVLVTSRDGSAGSWGPWSRRYRLGMLDADDAARVLGDCTGHIGSLGSDDDARELARRLGGLPLALKIAGSFLAESVSVPSAFAGPDLIRTYRQYLDALDSGDLGSVFPDPGGEQTLDTARSLIAHTWSISLDLLDARHLPEARTLLRLLACFANTPVPYELLLHPPTMSASPLFETLTGARLWQVLTALYSFGLVDLDVNDSPDTIPVARLHPLVYDVTSAYPATAPEGDEAHLRLAARLLMQATDVPEAGLPEDPQAWPAWQLLTPHAIHVIERLAEEPSYPDDTTASAAAYAGYMAARYQESQGLYAQAETLLRDVLVMRNASLGSDHPDTLITRREIARVMGERGDYAAAEAGFREVLAAQLRVLGPDHPNTLISRREIARAMRQQGQYAGAAAEFHEVLAVQLRVLGPDHQSTLITRYEIARVMAERGELPGAETELRGVLDAWLRVLGPDHPTTLAARHEIARIMGDRGSHAGAEAELRDVLAAQLRVLGPDHPDTLITRQEIAQEMYYRGDHSGAEADFRDVLAAQLRVLGPDHPDTLITRHKIARVMAEYGDSERAEAELRDVLAAQLRLLGPDHPDTAATARLLTSVAP